MPKRKRTGDFNAWRLEKLSDPVNAAHYLNAALEDSPDVFLDACKDVIQARKQVSKIARAAGVRRESIYRSFSSSGNPTLDVLYSVLKALELDLKIEPEARLPQVSRSARRRKKRRIGWGIAGVSQQQLTLPYDQNLVTAMTRIQAGTGIKSGVKPPEQYDSGAGSVVYISDIDIQAGFLPGFVASQTAGASSYTQSQ